jgi:uncharacterized protein YjbI with pentapeptide repeats
MTEVRQKNTRGQVDKYYGLTKEDIKRHKLRVVVNGYEIKPGVDLQGKDLRRANFSHLAIYAGCFYRADLKRASFRKADLRLVDFRGANLQNADFTAADLRGADFRGANLEGARLRNAKLDGVDLRDANLRNADLEGTYFDLY